MTKAAVCLYSADVYEEEGDLFFVGLSGKIIQAGVFMHLLPFNNLLITGYQAFFTTDALQSIAQVTLRNISDLKKKALGNKVLP
ncbi:hypothetical protein [uncultured Pontibacter sp.]|uniref:hypothetical protein n=1 Tax=uncultured Pontibacter sp. TaxID=453356 RepID=UPI00261E368C|nr:hypothetical protein [uncultured Pontibacter sp.]